MANKKRQIILTHGIGTPNADVVKDLKLGEVLVQHAADAKDAALHTVIEEGNTEGKIVSFPSKEWVSAEIAKVDAGGINEAIDGLNERLTAAEGEIDALQAADTTIRGEFAAADTAIRGEFAAADTAIRGEFAAADTAIRGEFAAADSALDEKITTNAGKIKDLEDADTAIRGEFAAADTAIRGEFAAADTAIRGEFAAEDTKIRKEFADADSALDEKITTNAGKIKDLEDADDALEAAYKAADEEVRGEFAAADKALEDAYKAADEELKDAYEAADKDLDERLGKIEGNDAGMSMREVAVDELAKQLIPEGAKEAMDTLEELAAWLQQHPEDAAAMNTAIAKNASDIAALDAAYKAADTSLNERLTTAEGEIDALQAADTTIRGEFAAADTAIRGEFAAADTAIRGEFAAADKALKEAYEAADKDLDERITEVEDAYIKSVVVKDAEGNVVATYTPVENVLDLSELVIDGGTYAE